MRSPPRSTASKAPLPFVQVKTVRGHAYHYFRTQRAGREIVVRMRGEPGSTEYAQHYAELRASLDGAPRLQRGADGTVAAMIEAYRASPEYTRLAVKTQRDYARAIETLAVLARFPARAITRGDVIKLRNKVSARSGPRAADLFVAVASRCFGVGLDLDYVERNPVESIERLAQSESYAQWSREDRGRFEDSAPPQHLMTAYMLCLWTALRIGDVVALGRQNDDGAGLAVRPQKTRRSSGVEIYIPTRPELRAYLASLPADRMLYVTRPDGAPVRADTVSKELRAWLEPLGLGGLHFHGLRHTTAAALAEAGASAHEIMAILGHTTLQMAERYTRTAARRRLAVAGMARLDEQEQNEKKGNSRGPKGNGDP